MLNTVLDVIVRYGVGCGVGRDVSSFWRLVFKLRGVWGTVGFSDFIVLNIVLAVVLCSLDGAVLSLLGWCVVGFPNKIPKANKNKSNIK